MSDFTRSTHTVRVKSTDKRFYADVEVLDAISMKLPNGFEICYKISKPNISSPNIIDQTGDGNGKGGGGASTRASHMVRVTSTTNTSMFFDVEVCDAFTITGPNNADFCIQCPTPGTSVPAIIDSTGSGLAVGANENSTRAQHVVKLLHQVGSGKAGQANQQVPTDYTLTLLTDALSYAGPLGTSGMPWRASIDFGGAADVTSFVDYQSAPWSDTHALKFYNFATVMNGALEIGANTNDTTQYVTDSGSGQTVPPDNTDPNVYVYFPQAPQSSDNTSGPFLGASPYKATGAPGGDRNIPAIDMGPIWWLRALGATDNVWFWYLSPVQQPLALSFFGDPPEGANPKWAYRGFNALPSFPVSYILSVNYPMIPMGTYGAPDLETAASGYTIPGGDGSIIVNWYGVTIPYKFAVSTAIADEGALVEAGFADYLAPIKYQGSSYYMPYGAFDLVGPNRADQLAAAKALGQSTSFWTDYGGPPANIWELTGIEQPPLADPSKIWNATTNPHLQPSLALAQQVAEKFRDNWNAVATSINSAASSVDAGSGIPGFPNVPPPGWGWAMPYGGDTLATAQEFSNGWVPAVLQVETVPITVPTIGVGQLDPKLWNVEPVLKTQDPPVLWATGIP